MIREKIRKEVSLDKITLEKLKIKAQEDGRNLKNYLEKILTEKANDDFEITEGYMKMIDEMLEKKAKGELKFTNWEDVKKKFNR
ncbi:hypothetical protein KSK37_11240 [Kaistella sp. DKR-2]|uniref:hypothetical protein n=1 Tax=Kaistella soli TaxID=2849654 RepID=UPI001C26DD1B|nr:hypothetical protein [Kaistella soli]MBU8883660.1 hypothetical protein [Kaistella soli]